VCDGFQLLNDVTLLLQQVIRFIPLANQSAVIGHGVLMVLAGGLHQSQTALHERHQHAGIEQAARHQNVAVVTACLKRQCVIRLRRQHDQRIIAPGSPDRLHQNLTIPVR